MPYNGINRSVSRQHMAVLFFASGDNMSMRYFYKSRKWKTKRQKILRRDEYLCRECRRYGRATPATTIHHIIPIEQRPELALVSRNLLSLCNECHNKMHDRETGNLTELGKCWVDRVSPHLRELGYEL